MNKELFTIGHSTHALEYFIALLKQHSITAVCDVRSHPHSRYNPQFNRESLQKELQKHRIEYLFLGKELGARRENPACYENGKVQYKRLEHDPSFQQGLTKITQELEAHSPALMCAEKEPLHCHRMIFVCRKIRPQIRYIKHILANGSTETNEQAEDRLLHAWQIDSNMDLFGRPKDDFLDEAYDKQGEKIAYDKNKKQAANS